MTQRKSHFLAERQVNGITVAAFLVVALGMLLLIGMGIGGLHATQRSLAHTSSHQQTAFQALFAMINASRDRSLILHRIHVIDDPFEIEDALRRYYALGTAFAVARAELDSLDNGPALEQALERQRELARQIVSGQERVIDLVRDERQREAERLLIEKVQPLQDRMLNELAEILRLQLTTTNAKIAASRDLASRLLTLLALVGGLSLLVVMLVGSVSRRYLLRTTHALEQQAEELKHSLSELESQKQALDAHDIVSVADATGAITYMNDRFCEVSQYGRDELIGKTHRVLKSGEHDAAFYARMWRTISSGEVWKGEICNRRKDGGLYWVATTIVPFLDADGLPYKYVSGRTDITSVKEAERITRRGKEELEALVAERTAALEDANQVLAREVDERKRLQAELETLVTTDGLTGVGSRRYFNQAFDIEIGRADRHDVALSLIFMDIDHFKRINDIHGHTVGDQVLSEFAALISGHVRAHDTFARWGGEEFVLLVPETGLDGARKLAEKLLALIRAAQFTDVGRVTCSFGVVERCAGETRAEVVARADEALYRAKAEGRNRVVALNAEAPVDD